MKRESIENRLMSKLQRGGPSECWVFTGALHDRDRYGLFYVNGKMERAHRVAYELTNGPLKEGQCVLHRCDNPPCCNPAHLFTGTKKRNMVDAKNKRRHAFGEKHGMAVITDAIAYDLRRQYAAGVTVPAIAEGYNVKRYLVEQIVYGLTWKHVRMVNRPKGTWRRNKILPRSELRQFQSLITS